MLINIGTKKEYSISNLLPGVREYGPKHVKRHVKFIKKSVQYGVKSYYLANRIELIKIMGNKCILCGFSDWRALQVDHINGNGKQEILKYQSKNIRKYYEKVKESVINNKKEYQLICANCNWIKRSENNENSKKL